MALQLILGSSGSGKTHLIYETINNASLLDGQTPLLLLVPEQFTLQTQREVIQNHPRVGIMNIEVLSFGRLAYRIYDDLEIADRKLLKDTGKSMVIRKLIQDRKENYPLLYPNLQRKGYIKELKDLITEFYQYNFSTQDIEKVEKDIKGPLLKDKMKDAHQLYGDFKNYLSEHYLTTESTMDFLVEGIVKCEWLSEAEVYIDGFYGFTPIQYSIISELLKKVKNLYVSITIDSNVLIDDLDDDSQLFYESKKMIQQLKQLAQKERVPVYEAQWLPDERPKRFDESGAIRHLEKNLYRYPYQIFEESPKGFNLSQATHMRQEVQYVADAIMKLVMSQGYSYKDISVVTGDLSGYENGFRQIFSSYDIPFFMDQKKPIMSHPMVQLLLAAMDVISKDFTYESIFRYLKSGLLETKGETLDALENYVLAYGIRGLKTWQQKWEKPYPLWKGDPEAEYCKKILDEMNLLKEGLLEPLIQLKKDIKKESPTVATTTKAVFNWMCTLRLEEKMTEQEAVFEKQGNLLYQREYSQIYKMIVDVLDQTVEILGDSAIVLKEYANLLQAGLEECEMGLVPPGLDQVVIGDLERTRLKEVKALFVIGFNEGKIPKKVSDANILTDYERQQLKALGIALAPDNKENIFKEQFSLYMGLLRVSKKLYLSYAKSDLQGKPMRPSLLFYTIKKMYPKIKVLDLEESYRNRLVINRPKPTFQHLIGNTQSSYKMGENDENVQAYRWFMAQDVWRPVVLALQEASKVSNHESALSPEMVEFLYGKELKNSVSRLETYARCPFAHFIDYGLHLRERLDYTVKMPDIGILFHRAIDLCSRKIDQRGYDWKNLEANVRDALVEQSVLEVVGEEQRGLFGGNARNAYMVKRLTRITKRAVWAISRQISKGEFKPTDYELSFDGSKNPLEALIIDFKDQKSMHLSGRIDRMDTYENEEALYLSVVDYKSGNQNFDLVALYYGLQLQLLVYLSAASELKKGPSTPKVTPAGVFYFHIDDPIIKDVSERNKENINSLILRELKLKGLVLGHQQIIRKLDATMGKTSEIIPVTLTSSGEISKTSSVATLEQWKGLENFVKDKVQEIGTDIVAGEVSAYPYKRKTETGCDYCPYSNVCRFEKGVAGNDYRVLKDLSKTEVWDKILEKTP